MEPGDLQEAGERINSAKEFKICSDDHEWTARGESTTREGSWPASRFHSSAKERTFIFDEQKPEFIERGRQVEPGWQLKRAGNLEPVGKLSASRPRQLRFPWLHKILEPRSGWHL